MKPSKATSLEIVPAQSSALHSFAPSREMFPTLGETTDAQQAEWVGEMVEAIDGGMRSLVLLMAFLILKERELELIPRAESIHRGPGKKPKGSGIKGWLAANQPKVTPQKFCRYKEVFEGIKDAFKFPAATVAKLGGFEAFVLTSPAKLSQQLALKQQELWEFVDGTSQRSWLDKFKRDTRGGDNTPRDADGNRIVHKLTIEETLAKLTAEQRDFVQEIVDSHFSKKKLWRLLSDDEIRGTVATFEADCKEMNAWLATPKGKRLGFTLDQI